MWTIIHCVCSSCSIWILPCGFDGKGWIQRGNGRLSMFACLREAVRDSHSEQVEMCREQPANSLWQDDAEEDRKKKKDQCFPWVMLHTVECAGIKGSTDLEKVSKFENAKWSSTVPGVFPLMKLKTASMQTVRSPGLENMLPHSEFWVSSGQSLWWSIVTWFCENPKFCLPSSLRSSVSAFQFPSALEDGVTSEARPAPA